MSFAEKWIWNDTVASSIYVVLTSVASGMVLSNSNFKTNFSHGLANGLSYIGASYAIDAVNGNPNGSEMSALVKSAATGGVYLVGTGFNIPYLHDGRDMSNKFLFSSLNALGAEIVKPVMRQGIDRLKAKSSSSLNNDVSGGEDSGEELKKRDATKRHKKRMIGEVNQRAPVMRRAKRLDKTTTADPVPYNYDYSQDMLYGSSSNF